MYGREWFEDGVYMHAYLVCVQTLGATTDQINSHAVYSKHISSCLNGCVRVLLRSIIILLSTTYMHTCWLS